MLLLGTQAKGNAAQVGAAVYGYAAERVELDSVLISDSHDHGNFGAIYLGQGSHFFASGLTLADSVGGNSLMQMSGASTASLLYSILYQPGYSVLFKDAASTVTAACVLAHEVFPFTGEVRVDSLFLLYSLAGRLHLATHEPCRGCLRRYRGAGTRCPCPAARGGLAGCPRPGMARTTSARSNCRHLHRGFLPMVSNSQDANPVRQSAGRSANYARLRELFDACVDLPEGDRLAFIERNVTDEAMRVELALMLAQDESPANPFATAPLQKLGELMDDGIAALPDLIGSHCGPFRLMRLIGSGGQGAVYLGERGEGQSLRAAGRGEIAARGDPRGRPAPLSARSATFSGASLTQGLRV